MRVLICFCVAVLWTFQLAAQSYVERRYSDTEWREDIAFYVQTLKVTHINPYHSVAEEDFESAVQNLSNRVPNLNDCDIAMELIAISAMTGDGHTWMRFGDSFQPRRLSLQLREFDDGVFVVAAMPGFEAHIGKRVLSIGGHPVESLLVQALRYTSGDNAWGPRDRRASWLGSEAFLVHERVIAKGDSVRLGLDGEEVEFNSVLGAAYSEWAKEVSVKSDSELPLYRQRPGDHYWLRYLRKHKTVYVKFNVVGNQPGGPHLRQFSMDMLELVDSKNARKLIIDVRNNGGGNGNLTSQMIPRIAANKRINQSGRLFVLTSRHTFSAALMFTVRIERATAALFAGEPGGGKPNSYGEFNAFTLPHSGMSGSISSRWHEEGEPDDTREFLPVDIAVPFISRDYFASRDPVLAAVLAYGE